MHIRKQTRIEIEKILSPFPLPKQTVSNSRHLRRAKAPLGTPSNTISTLFTKSWSNETLVKSEKNSRTLLCTHLYSASRVSSPAYPLNDNDTMGCSLSRLKGPTAREEPSAFSASMIGISSANGLSLSDPPDTDGHEAPAERKDIVTSRKLFNQYTRNAEILLGCRTLGASSRITRRNQSPLSLLFIGERNEKAKRQNACPPLDPHAMNASDLTQRSHLTVPRTHLEYKPTYSTSTNWALTYTLDLRRLTAIRLYVTFKPTHLSLGAYVLPDDRKDD